MTEAAIKNSTTIFDGSGYYSEFCNHESGRWRDGRHQPDLECSLRLFLAPHVDRLGGHGLHFLAGYATALFHPSLLPHTPLAQPSSQMVVPAPCISSKTAYADAGPSPSYNPPWPQKPRGCTRSVTGLPTLSHQPSCGMCTAASHGRERDDRVYQPQKDCNL